MVLAVLAALFLAADVGLRLWAQAALAARIGQSLGTSAQPELDLDGFPFLFQVAAGRFDGVEIEAEAVDAEGLVLRDVALDLRDVSFSMGALLDGTGTFRAERGSGQAMVTDEDLSSFVQTQGHPVDVRFEGRGVRVLTTLSVGPDQVEVSATGPLELRRGRLRFRPRTVRAGGTIAVPASAFAIDVPLPTLLPGLRYERLVVRRGTAELHVEINNAVIPAGG